VIREGMPTVRTAGELNSIRSSLSLCRDLSRFRPCLSVPVINESKPVELSSYGVDPSAAYEDEKDWKSTIYASTKLVIDVVKESSDVFTPLKSVAGFLSAVLKHCDVRHVYFARPSTSLTVTELARRANCQTVESLIPRVEGLAESLPALVPEGKIKEGEREGRYSNGDRRLLWWWKLGPDIRGLPETFSGS